MGYSIFDELNYRGRNIDLRPISDKENKRLNREIKRENAKVDKWKKDFWKKQKPPTQEEKEWFRGIFAPILNKEV